jgi:hypothetical protein
MHHLDYELTSALADERRSRAAHVRLTRTLKRDPDTRTPRKMLQSRGGQPR